MIRKFRLRNLRYVFATIFVAVISVSSAEILSLVSTLMLRSPLEGLENQLSDLAFQVRPENKLLTKVKPDEIVIIDVDDASIDKLGRTQMWPRAFDANVINYIASGNPKSIAIDFLYTEEDYFTEAYKDILEDAGFVHADTILRSLSTDNVLSEAIRNSGNVYLSFFDDWAARDSTRTIAGYPGIRFVSDRSSGKYQLPQLVHPVLPIRKFAEGARAVSPITMPTEDDGTVRNYPLLESVQIDTSGDSRVIAHFPAYIIADHFGVADSQIVLKDQFFEIGTDFKIPVENDGSFRLNWLGNTESIRYISYYKAMREIAPSEFFEGKYVFIGTSAAGLEDLKTVPCRKTKMPGVEVHAVAFLNMVNGAFLTEITRRDALPYFLIVSVFLVAIFLILKPLAGFILTILIMAGELFGFLLWLIPEKSIYIPVVELMLITFFSYFFSSLYTYLVREKKNRRLKYAFGSYVSPVVVDQIMKEASMLKLGGQKKNTYRLVFRYQRLYNVFRKPGP